MSEEERIEELINEFNIDLGPGRRELFIYEMAAAMRSWVDHEREKAMHDPGQRVISKQ